MRARRESTATARKKPRRWALRRDAGHEDPTLLLAEIIALEGWGKTPPVVDRLTELEPTAADGKRWLAEIRSAVIARESNPKK